MIIWVGELSSQNMKLSVSNGIKLLLKRVYQKFTNGSRTKKSTPKGVSPLSVLLLFPLIVKYKKHNYFWMGGVSIISGTLFRVRQEPFLTSKIIMLVIIIFTFYKKDTIYFLLCQYYFFCFQYYVFSASFLHSVITSLILPLCKRLIIFDSCTSCIVATYK